MPLYNKAYILKVEAVPKTSERKDSEVKTPVEEETDAIVSYILICPYVYQSNIHENGLSQFHSGTKLGRLFIKEQYTTYIDRKEYDVINLIPKKMISDLRREIIYSISRYGVTWTSKSIAKQWQSVGKRQFLWGT